MGGCTVSGCGWKIQVCSGSGGGTGLVINDDGSQEDGLWLP